MSASRPPLAGVRVLDLTRLLPGPACTMHLADMGAEVVKIEDPDGGDYARHLLAGPDGASAFFRMINRNKKSVALDLRLPADRERFLALADTADVVVESFRPGVTANLGVDYPVLSVRNPKLVYAAITGYGQTGPYRDRAGHDLNYLGYAGVLDQIGTAGGPPVIPNLQIADLLGGAMTGVMGILAALYDARRSGQGRYVDVAMLDGAYAHHVMAEHALQSFGRTAPRGQDMLTGGIACYQVYATADGRHLAVGALEPKFWSRFCAVVERPDWVSRQYDLGRAGRDLQAEVAALVATRTLGEWATLLDNVDCCVTPVKTPAEAAEDPQLRARAMVQVAPDGTRCAGLPVKFSDYTFTIARPAPALDADRTAILGDASE